MIDIIEINKICDELGTAPPKVVEYANCNAIIILNGDGLKVLIVADEGMSRESVKHRIAAAFKVKAENLASEDKLAEAFKELVTEAHKTRLQTFEGSTYQALPDPFAKLETHAKASKPDPVTPAKEIRAHQEGKKPHNK